MERTDKMRLDGKRKSAVDVILREVRMRKEESGRFSDLFMEGCSYPINPKLVSRFRHPPLV